MNESKSMKELTRIREEHGLSQQRLADASGVNKATINQIERGRRSPNVETLEKLAAALGIETADLFPKAQAPLPLKEYRWHGAEGYPEIADPATESWPYRALDSWVRLLRALIKDYEPITRELPEKPSLELFLEARMKLVPLSKYVDSINEALMESGVAEASNELLVASKPGEGGLQDLEKKVREFHDLVNRLNSELMLPAIQWLLETFDWLQHRPEPVPPEIKQFRKQLEGLETRAKLWVQEYKKSAEHQSERVRMKGQSA